MNQILNKYTDEVICESDNLSIKELAQNNNANLENANLINANLPIFCKWLVNYKVVSNDEKITIDDIDINSIEIAIGCKSKTIKEWDLWFKSQEEYSTKRDTFEFKQIHGMYKAYRTYLTTVYGEINE